jgi:hypothetical protein
VALAGNPFTPPEGSKEGTDCHNVEGEVSADGKTATMTIKTYAGNGYLNDLHKHIQWNGKNAKGEEMELTTEWDVKYPKGTRIPRKITVGPDDDAGMSRPPDLVSVSEVWVMIRWTRNGVTKRHKIVQLPQAKK